MVNRHFLLISPYKSLYLTAKEKAAWSMSQSQQAWDRAQGKGAAKPATREKPSIREELAAGKKQLAVCYSVTPGMLVYRQNTVSKSGLF
jgi:hypothetical protein